jgi:hypothetical protein
MNQPLAGMFFIQLPSFASAGLVEPKQIVVEPSATGEGYDWLPARGVRVRAAAYGWRRRMATRTYSAQSPRQFQ